MEYLVVIADFEPGLCARSDNEAFKQKPILTLAKHPHTPVLVKLVLSKDAQLFAYPVLLKHRGEVSGVDTREEHFSGDSVLPWHFLFSTITNLNVEELRHTNLRNVGITNGNF